MVVSSAFVTLITLRTERLVLRPWVAADKPLFAALNADAEVMQYFPALLSREESDAMVKHMSELITKQGWGFWAVERTSDARFMGMIGLNDAQGMPFSPCLEVGWRLARPFWKQGYATEGARACLDFAMTTLQASQVVAFTATLNVPSQAVMRRLNMVRCDVFEHPRVPVGNPLRPHLLFVTR